MREELRNAKRREREAEKAKREMVGELSHDLKTPVATIQATCEVMDLKSRMKLKALERELQKIQTRMEQSEELEGNERLAEVEGNIRELQENIEKIGYITKKADTINQLVGNVFRATLENSIPECLVCFDGLRMEQVIDNVVGNSYKYAGTDIHVSFRETENLPTQSGAKDRYIQITIRDEGPGVSEEELPLIAQKFYRGKNAQDKQGYGLGLYLVKWYMEKQGGGMEYHNDHGFVVELWVKKV